MCDEEICTVVNRAFEAFEQTLVAAFRDLKGAEMCVMWVYVRVLKVVTCTRLSNSLLENMETDMRPTVERDGENWRPENVCQRSSPAVQ